MAGESIGLVCLMVLALLGASRIFTGWAIKAFVAVSLVNTAALHLSWLIKDWQPLYFIGFSFIEIPADGRPEAYVMIGLSILAAVCLSDYGDH